ncbi:MAG: hypothetical protein ED557_06935 [Balneola sp.]|nr:MAG: hypothetical protein ED557_06935 [Balneola sp.]
MTTNAIKHHFSKDGSSTLYSENFQQYYHNPNGAVSESQHIFFDIPGLTDRILAKNDTPLSILEIGFGTGLNFLLLLDKYLSANSTRTIHFSTVEAFPISGEFAKKLNFQEFLNNDQLLPFLTHVFHSLENGTNTFKNVLGTNVRLDVFYGLFESLEEVSEAADFVFHDAFSPEVNPELWSIPTFEKIALFCKKDCILSTYGAASKARAALAKAGWYIAKAPGALGKREMTIASLTSSNLKGFTRLNEERLINRFDKGDFGN